jgi:prolyl-tRNA synthetase
MQDGKALQSGTSHFLGQNFAKAFDVKFTTNDGSLDYVWASSWGVSTRLVGALIMAHSDDDGLVLPPKLAPIQAVIVPIYNNRDEMGRIAEVADKICKTLRDKGYSVHFDDRDTQKPGWKFAHYEMKGVPVRIAIGPRDLEKGTVEIARRDTLRKETFPLSELQARVEFLMSDIQNNIFNKALEFRINNTYKVDTYEELKTVVEDKGGFAFAHWDGTSETEMKIKEETKATIRCIPFDDPGDPGKCIFSGKDSKQRVYFARAY